MTAQDPSELEFAAAEIRCLDALGRAHWFSVRAEGSFQAIDQKSIRAFVVAIRTSQVVLLESRDVQLSGNHEAFRISLRESSGLNPPDSEGLDICGGVAPWLADIGILPQPAAIEVVWTAHEYGVAAKHFSRTLSVTVPDALIIHGRAGRLLLTPDEVPNWLLASIDSQRIDDVIGNSQRIRRMAPLSA